MRVFNYERRSPNPTLDVIQKIAAALEISVTELLGEKAVAVRKARTNVPVGKVREVFDRVSKLPPVSKSTSSIGSRLTSHSTSKLGRADN